MHRARLRKAKNIEKRRGRIIIIIILIIIYRRRKSVHDKTNKQKTELEELQ